MSQEGFLAQKKQTPAFATNAIHVGQDPENWKSYAVVPPLSMSTTFKQFAPAQHAGYEYGRSGNPTRNVLQECLASLDNGEYGLCFSSGLGATTALAHLMSAGDHMISVDDVYGGTYRYFTKAAARFGIETTYVDATDPANVEKAIKANTKMVWLESPTNPLLKVMDIKAIAEMVHKHKDILLVVDNTFLTSYFQRPLELGADIVMYSLTKYMNGHSDVIMGAMVTNNKEVHEKMTFLQNALGIVPSPFDCYLVNRSLKTLHVRMREHMKNGFAVARFLEKHPLVQKVIHPGLPSHPQHEVAKRQCYGHSGIQSFCIKGGLTEASKFLQALKVFTLAESLGGYESLAELPSLMTHASVPAEERNERGITDNLIRLSVGLEDAEDLIADLEQALKASVSHSQLDTVRSPVMEEEGFLPIPEGFSTTAVHAGKDPDKWNSGASVPPISMAANFKHSTPTTNKGHLYSRYSNPTRDCLQEGLAALDNAKYCLCFSSGMGAITALGHLLKSGDHIVSVDNIYGGTYHNLTDVLHAMSIETTFVDGTDLKKVQAALKPNTKMLWIETPTNPLLSIIDLKEMVKIAKKHGNVIVVVDNTFLTPFFQRPLDFGVDVAMYSVSKYLNGHSDVVMGAITTNDESIYKRLNHLLIYLGVNPSPFDCFLVSRSLNTLSLRMTAHMKNGLTVARYLEKHPMVEKVIHPALPSHPQHKLAKQQSSGHSGMLAVYLKANLEQTTKFLSSLKLFMLAGSLGGHRSSSALCCVMTHPQYPKEVLNKNGITENMVRLSIGLENPQDLIADLEHGFAQMKKM